VPWSRFLAGRRERVARPHSHSSSPRLSGIDVRCSAMMRLLEITWDRLARQRDREAQGSRGSLVGTHPWAARDWNTSPQRGSRSGTSRVVRINLGASCRSRRSRSGQSCWLRQLDSGGSTRRGSGAPSCGTPSHVPLTRGTHSLVRNHRRCWCPRHRTQTHPV
jgi:hypothetical protein